MQLIFNEAQFKFVVQLLLAEMIFLYPMPKRKLFWPKLLGMSTVLILVVSYYQRINGYMSSVPADLGFFFGIFALTVIGMMAAFKAEPVMMTSMCAAGYASQHMAHRMDHIISHVAGWSSSGNANLPRLFDAAVFLGVYALIWLSFGRFSARNECWRDNDKRFNYASMLIIFICVGLSRCTTIFNELPTKTGSLYAVICCVLALYIQFILHRMMLDERERAAMDRMRQEQVKQYEISRNAIESLNIRLHDVRQRLLHQEDMESIQRDMQVYENSMHTGNEVLDVLLTEKCIRCSLKGIHFSCSGDFAPISFMKVTELYSLFGNAIDNAVEAVEKLNDTEKRVIDLSIEERGDLVFVVVSNYFNGILPDFDHPETTKTEEPGYHGYGIKSMKLLAAKYGGALNFTAEDDLFTLQLYMQKPKMA